MRIKEILMHQTPSKARIFARAFDNPYDLHAVTSLGPDALHSAKDLVSGLTEYLATRNQPELDEILTKVPEAVAKSVRQFVKGLAPLEPGDTDDLDGLIEDFRCFYTSIGTTDLRDFIDAASQVSMGVRIDNEISPTDTAWWQIVLRSEEPAVIHGDEPRAWSPPKGLKLQSTWSTIGSKRGVDAVVEVAENANKNGKYVRVHSFMKFDTPDTDSTATLEYVVDIFDAPIPHRPE